MLSKSIQLLGGFILKPTKIGSAHEPRTGLLTQESRPPPSSSDFWVRFWSGVMENFRIRCLWGCWAQENKLSQDDTGTDSLQLVWMTL